MAGRVQVYREELRKLKSWEPYLKRNSGLPGPRANLELVMAVAEEGDADRLWRLSASQDEYLALCGTAGLGRIALLEPDTVMSWLRELASDPRWRVREGVAMALQRLGREDMPRLLAEMKDWAHGDPFVQRAAVAGLCEPAILVDTGEVVEVLAILDRITASLAAGDQRREEGFRALRQALGYGWSVAAAAAPDNAVPYIEKWLSSKDKDVAWIMKSNLSKARMKSFPVLPIHGEVARSAGGASKPARRSRSVSRAKSAPAAARGSRSASPARRARRA
jgi:hypothetical protein